MQVKLFKCPINDGVKYVGSREDHDIEVDEGGRRDNRAA